MSNKVNPSQLLREKWLLSELPEADQQAFEASLSAEERAGLREADELLRQEMLEALPSRVLKARVQQVLDRERAARRRAFFFAAPAFGAVLAALLLFVRPTGEVGPTTHSFSANEDPERSKGLAPRLVVFRQLENSAEQLKSGDEVKARDLLQLGYVAAGRRYGVLLSIDGRGVVTLHSPRPPLVNPELLEEPKTQLLALAYELDDAPRFERFFFVTSREALRLESVLAAAEELARDPERAMTGQLELSANVEQASILLRKATSIEGEK